MSLYDVSLIQMESSEVSGLNKTKGTEIKKKNTVITSWSPKLHSKIPEI